MLRKTMLMASMAVMAVAFAVPSVASANWTDATVALLSGNNPVLQLVGPAKFEGGLGSTSCTQTTAQVQLTGGQADAHVNSFSVDNPTGCETQGALAFCQLHTVTFEGTAGGPPANSWTAHATTQTEDILITKVEFQNHYGGGFCPTPTIQLHGDITLVPKEKHNFHQGTFHGTLTATSKRTGEQGGSHLGSVTASGSGSVTPATTYGLT